MTGRTAQCQECTTVFDVESETGRAPARCPSCRKDAAERSASKPSKKTRATPPVQKSAKRAPSRAPGGPIADAIAAMQLEVEQLDERRAAVLEAISSLEALSGGPRR